MIFPQKNRTYWITRLKHLLPRSRWSVGFSVFFVALLLGGSFLFFHTARAMVWSVASAGESIVEGVTQILFAAAKLFLSLTVFCLRFFLDLAAYNDYISSPVVLVGWFMIRDLANMFFVVALLAIAFGTILGLEQYEWKKSLAKLVLAAILINFSRLICQFLIDISHIFTITFLDAVAGAAGTNLIQMFKLDTVLSMVKKPQISHDEVRTEFFVAGLMAVIFSLVALVTIGAYVVLMVIRVVMLWLLIILSPLAFVLSAIPQTKNYADEFWQEFIKYIIVAPLMVFFLWLSFATLGAGNINNYIGIDSDPVSQADKKRLELDGTQAASLTEISTWENMSAFIIAIAFLFAGLERVGKIGVRGGSVLSAATSASEKILFGVSGFAAGRWAVGGATTLAGKGIKAGLYHMPLGGRFWKRQGQALYGRAMVARGKMVENSSERAKKWEEKGFLGKIAARIPIIGESAGRADKRAKDWLEAAERQEKIVEETYSTSSTSMSGKVKLDVTTRLKQAEDVSEIKGAQKVEEHAVELLATDDRYKKRANTIETTKAKSEIAKGVIDSEKERRLEAAREIERGGPGVGVPFMKAYDPSKREDAETLRVQQARLAQAAANKAASHIVQEKTHALDDRVAAGAEKAAHADDHALGHAGSRLHVAHEQEAQSKAVRGGLEGEKKRAVAEAEVGARTIMARDIQTGLAGEAEAAVLTEQAEEDRIRQSATEKSTAYHRNGEDLKGRAALADAEDQITKKRLEAYNKLNYTERMLEEARQELEMQAAQAAMVVAPVGTAAHTRAQTRYHRAIRQKSALTTTQNNTDAESSRDGLLNALNALNWFTDPNGDAELDDTNIFRAQLSRSVGRLVRNDPGDIACAIADFEAGHSVGDNPQAQHAALQAAYRSLLGSQKSAAFKGDAFAIGHIGEGSDPDPARQGQVLIRWGSNVGNERNGAPRALPQANERSQDIGYFIDRVGRNSLDKISSFGSVNREGNLTGFTPRQANQAASLFQGMDAHKLTSIPPSVWESLNVSVVANRSSADEFTTFLEQVQIALGNDHQAIERFYGFTERLRTSITTAGGTVPALP